MFLFKNFNGEDIEINNYLKQQIENDPSLTISVGCDSRQIGGKTVFVIALVFHSAIYCYGAHVIYSKLSYKKIKDTFQKLWKEVELLYQAGEFISKNLDDIGYKKPYNKGENYKFYYKPVDLHIDINPNKNFLSYRLHSTATSWLKGCGYKTFSKPYSFAATSAADHIV